jgi:hypothetical protein
MYKLFKVLIILFLVTTDLFAIKTRVTAEVDKKRVIPKESVKITIRVLTNKDSNITFTHMEDIAGAHIFKRDGERHIEPIDVGGKIENVLDRTIIYIIKPEKDLVIPSFLVKVNNKKHKTRPIKISIIKDDNSKVVTKTTTASTKIEKKEPEKKTEKKEVTNVDVKKNIDTKNNQQISVKAEKSLNNNIKPSKPKKSILKITISKKSVIEGEPFYAKAIFKVPLCFAPATDTVKIDDPNFKNCHVIKQESKSRVYKDSEYIIFEKKYFVVPIKAGKIVIYNMANLDLVPSVSNTMFDFFGNKNQDNTIHSNKVTLDVLPKPNNIDIVGDSYKISYNVNKIKTSPDKEIVYKVKIEGYGDLSLLKSKKFKIPNVLKIDNDKDAKITYSIKSGRVYSKYEKEYVFISDSDFTIPSIKIRAYSLANKKSYTLSTKPIKITVMSHNKKINKLEKTEQNYHFIENQTIKSQNKTEQPKRKRTEQLLLDIKYYKNKIEELDNPYKQFGIFILGLIAGILATIFLPKLIKLIKIKDEKSELYGSYHEALNILYPHTTKSTEIEEMVKQLYEVTNGNKDIIIDNKKLDRLVKKIKKA